ncbi:hypothetical protein Q5M44_01000 [Acinetobacter pittii]|uniref:hypothetical protein n=1 Tax=Acinetobacter pittii TaxID=48296 RepID=UPI0026F008E0|nr:hypothetical protein [Acinetobacter pittii]MDO7243110.1 hypothetical protein [Acinetobacter pittii]
MNPIFPKFSTPQIDDKDLINFAKSISPNDVVKVPYFEKLLPLGNCYWNVENMVKTYGGSIEYGWIFNSWNNVLIEAMHHALWKDKNGKLFDVTQNYPMFSKDHIVFISDSNSTLESLDIPPAIHNHYYLISDDMNAKNFVLDHKTKIELVRKHLKALYESGYRCEGQRALAAGKNFNPNSLKLKQHSPEALKGLMEIRQQIGRIEQRLGAYISQLNRLSS